MKLSQSILFIVVAAYSVTSYSQSNFIQFSVGQVPPYVIDSEKKQGLATEIVKEALALQKLKAKITFDSWRNARLAIDSQHHSSFWWLKNKERDKKWLFSSPIYKAEYVFLARKDVRLYWQRFDQLRSYRLGLSKIQSYGDTFDDYTQYLNVTRLSSDYSGIKRLVNNELDAILIERSAAQYLLSHFKKAEQKLLELHLDQVLHSEPYFMVCAKSYSLCNYNLEMVNSGVNKLKSSGKYDKIIKSYFEK